MSSEVPSTSSGQAPSTSSPAGQAGQAPPTGSPVGQAGQVLYRKWRPQTFSEIVGQEPVTRTLRNSVASGRIAHAYLLSGPRGTGKTSLGRLIAKAANCTSPGDGEPCNECDSCRAFLEGRAIDFIEQDAASHNSVDDIRQLRENVVLNPMSGEYKVYLLDEVHMLSGSAENALLKTLEEPPPHVIFVLATTEPHRVSATIISRCQRFDLRRIPTPAVAERLAFIGDKEGFTLDEVSLQEVARSASGSLRDAINGLEQIVTYYGASPSPEQVREALGISVDARSAQLARLLLADDPSAGSLGGQAGQALAEGLKLVAAVRDDGVDMRRFSREVVGYLRELLLVKAGVADTLDQTKETLAAMQALAKQANRAAIVSALKAIGRLDFRDDPQSSLPLELALVELVAEAEKPVERPATPAKQAVPAPAEKPEPQPQFSIPASTAEEVAATATGATVGAPEPEAAEAEPAPTPAGVPADLLSRVRNACKESDKQLGAILNASCEVTSLEEDVLTLGFYHTFHLERMEAERYGGRLSELLSQELGRPVTAKLVHSPRRPTPGKVKSGHLVQAAQELGAKPVQREPEGQIEKGAQHDDR